jgi:MFS family permease
MLAVLPPAWVLPGLLGPAIAGTVAEATTWRLVFLGLLPLIAIAAALTVPAIRAVPDADPPDPDAVPDALPDGAAAAQAGPLASGSRVSPRARLPWAIVLVLGAATLLSGLTNGQLIPGGPLIALGLAVVIPAYRALTPPGTLRVAPGIPAAVLIRGLLTFAFFAADAFVPLAIHDWRGFSAIVAGIALTAATLAWTTGAWIQARRHARWGARRMVTLGYGALLIGIAGFGAILAPEVPIAFGIVAWAIAGLGMGFAYAPLTLAPPQRGDGCLRARRDRTGRPPRGARTDRGRHVASAARTRCAVRRRRLRPGVRADAARLSSAVAPVRRGREAQSAGPSST